MVGEGWVFPHFFLPTPFPTYFFIQGTTDMLNSILLFAESNLAVTGDLSELAGREEWGIMMACLVVVALLMITILGGVGLGVKSVLKILHQTIDGYNKLTVSIDRLSDSQQELQEWLKSQTKELQSDIDGIEEGIKSDHSMLLDHDKTIKEHTTQIENLQRKGK